MAPARRSALLPRLLLVLGFALPGAALLPAVAACADEPGEALRVTSPGPAQDRPDAWRWQQFQSRLTGRPASSTLIPAEGTDEEPAAGFPISGGPTTDGQWFEIPPPALWLHTMIYDPLRDRLLVFGGVSYRGPSSEVWQLNLSAGPHWQPLTVGGAGPAPRSRHTAVYDRLRDRVIVFGGYDGAEYKNDVWALDLDGPPTWSRLEPAAGPSPRGWHAAVFDATRGRMVVYGGADGGSTFGDVWALSLDDSPTWTQLAPAGTGPGPRFSSPAVYDAPRDRIVFYGGIDGSNTTRTDVWALSLAGPPAWSEILPAGTPPSLRNGASAIFDPIRQRLVLFAGGTGRPNLNETWALALGAAPAWTQLVPASPPGGRQFHAAAYDPIGDRLLVFGGSDGPILSGTWALSLSATEAWIPFSSTRRRGHLAAYDEPRRRLLVFGGDDGGVLDDVWELGLDAQAAWLRLTPAGTPPAARAFHAGVYDPQRDRLIIFGGRDSAPRNDTWELSLSGALAWRRLLPGGGAPSARIDHAAVYDPVRRRMIVFGGAGDGAVYNDVWALSLSGSPTWTQLSPLGAAPVARGGAMAIYDPGRDRVVIFGGYSKSLVCLDDTWELRLAGTPTWSRLYPAGAVPDARLAAAAVYDPQRDREILLGGTDLISYFSDAWQLSLSDTLAWTRLTPVGTGPLSRSDHKAVYDAPADRVVLFGGGGLGGGLLNDTWALHFFGTIDVPAAAAAVQPRIWPAWPNPARGSVRLEFESPTPAAARIAVYAVSGRLVRELVAGPVPAGRHAATWDGTDTGGSRVPAGVYFYRVSLGAARRDGKIVLLD
jgi:hypothetical protein